MPFTNIFSAQGYHYTSVTNTTAAGQHLFKQPSNKIGLPPPGDRPAAVGIARWQLSIFHNRAAAVEVIAILKSELPPGDYFLDHDVENLPGDDLSVAGRCLDDTCRDCAVAVRLFFSNKIVRLPCGHRTATVRCPERHRAISKDHLIVGQCPDGTCTGTGRRLFSLTIAVGLV